MLGVVLINVLVALASRGEGARGPRPAGALVLAVGEPVTALAAGDEVVVAATERGDVLLLDGDGIVRRRFRLPEPPAPSGGRARAERIGDGGGRGSGRAAADGFLVGAGVPSDDDFNDPYDVDSQVEDPTNVLRDDGASERRTGRGRPTGADAQVSVAAGGRTAWFAQAQALLRTSLDASTPPERVGRSSTERWSALAASGDGRWLAGVRGGWLVRSADAGETFAALAPVAGPARRLAVTNDGDVLVVDGNGARRVGAPAPGAASAWPAALDLCASERGTVILTDGALVLEQRADGPPAIGANAGGSGSLARGATDLAPTASRLVVVPDDIDRLACGRRDEDRAVGGASLWTSSDAGRTWWRHSEMPPVAVTALAIAGGATWVATRAGLWRVPVHGSSDVSRQRMRSPSPERPRAQPVAGEGDGLTAPTRAGAPAPFVDLSLEARRPPWWAGALPRVDLAFTWATGGGRRDVRAFVLLSFAIERDSSRALLHRRLMRQVLRRRNELEGTALALSAANSAASDPIDVEERAALAHVLEVPHD